jgi:hypothetical protein
LARAYPLLRLLAPSNAALEWQEGSLGGDAEG